MKRTLVSSDYNETDFMDKIILSAYLHKWYLSMKLVFFKEINAYDITYYPSSDNLKQINVYNLTYFIWSQYIDKMCII